MPIFATYHSLHDKNVFITGGASGIGEVAVRAFSEQGANVGFIDNDKIRGEIVADETGASFEHADLRDIENMQTGIENLRDALGPFDVLINNAANDDRHRWEDVSEDYWDERMATNLKHMFFAIQAIAPDMIEKEAGSIINMGSNSWWEASGDMPAYTTAKSAVHGLTRGMARDLGEYNIRVNSIVPGWIMTDRQKDLWITPEKLSAHLEDQCLPHPIDPIYVVNMMLFLASDDSAMCTASDFRVEAGSI